MSELNWNWTEMQFITVIIIRHANDINDRIELKLKFNGIEIDEPEIATENHYTK